MRRARIFKSLAAVLTVWFMVPGAQAQDLGVTLTPVVTIDSELVFSSTSLGQQISKDLENKVQELAAENIQIARDLEAQELDLTQKRTEMDPVAFRALADAFDEKVQRIRNEQDAKQRALQQRRDAERQSFLDGIAPLLSEIARKHSAVVVLERRSVLLSADNIDITQEVIDRIENALAARQQNAQTPENTPDDNGAVDPQSLAPDTSE